MKQLCLLIGTAVLGILLVSCSAQKRVWYLQDAQPFTPEQIAENGQIRIKPLDRLTIVVNSKDPELAVPFNSATSYNSLTGTNVSSAANSQALQMRTVDENGMLLNERITCRHRDEIIAVDREVIDYIDVSPKMMTSIATAFIPFLQNDDANRALMGANMQRQAVPLMVTEAPIVATGVEQKCAVDSEVCIKAEGDGVVTRVSADGVSVRYDDGSVRDYTLTKFARSNQGTCVNQRPIVTLNQRVEKGDVIADGPATDHGEISLGKNALVGFMTWEGYNYEDAVLINEKMVRNDVYTSIHIEKHEIEARDTKLGPEEITRDIPNVSDDLLSNLDERGIIRVGAEVHSGDILVGKVTPKGETELTAAVSVSCLKTAFCAFFFLPSWPGP